MPSQFVTPVIDRRYRWDKRNQLIERSVSYAVKRGEVFTAGHWYYHKLSVRPTGAVDGAFRVGTNPNHFLYDAAANLLTSSAHRSTA